ncbi:MAG: hypothetical protein AB1552_11730 [Nitrospirota bacterium]
MFAPFTTTGIGSLPHTDTEKACRLILETFDIPFWPQFPCLSFRELMIPQYSEGMPCLRIDEKRETAWIEKDGDELTKFYDTYTDDLLLPVSDAYAQGFHAFIRSVQGSRFAFLKGHVTGPLTFTLGIKDSGGKLLYFDEELREIALMVLKAKIRWQVKALQSHADQVIIFIDEPILSALGSSGYLGVAADEALRLLKETADTVMESGAISGIHCCSKADWPLVIGSGAHIISFDAYDYLETISLFPSEFTGFLKRGGYLAWGIVPTTELIRVEDTGTIKERFDQGIETLSRSIPADLLRSQILLTPSCGTGSRSTEEAEKVFRILVELKEALLQTRR